MKVFFLLICLQSHTIDNIGKDTFVEKNFLASFIHLFECFFLNISFKHVLTELARIQYNPDVQVLAWFEPKSPYPLQEKLCQGSQPTWKSGKSMNYQGL